MTGTIPRLRISENSSGSLFERTTQMCASSSASSSEKAWGRVLTPSPTTRMRASAS